MRVFIGLTNIASMFGDLRDAFAELGVATYTVSRHAPAVISGDQSDFNIHKAKGYIPYFKPRRISARLKSWWDSKIDDYVYKKAVKDCDIFIFFWDTFKPDHSDLAELKKKNKLIVSVFVGDDVRWYPSMKQEFEKYGLPVISYPQNYDHSPRALEKRLSLIRTSERYADHIFSRLDQAQLQLRPYYRWNMMVPPAKFHNKPEQRKDRPLVAHAPSNRSIKGTSVILEVFERLKNEGVSFESLLIENMPNSKAIELYGDADIVIDQLLCPGGGKLGTEALASGCIVMSNMSYGKYPQKNPADCPIIDINPDNLYEKLKELILNYEFRCEHAKKGMPYVEQHLDVKHFCKKVLALARNEKIEADYQPAFFRNEFQPESKESVDVYNKWTAAVKTCDWYEKNIEPGTRDGLSF